MAAHLDRSGGDGLAVARGQHVGVERDEAERHPRSRSRRPVFGQQPVDDVLEVALPRRRAQLDPLEPLDAAGSDVAGDHDAQRRAVHGRERLAVHRPDEEHFRAACLVERDRAAEALDRFGLRADVGALEADMRRVAERAGEREHVGERDAAPRRGPRRAGTPRRLARDVADGDQTRAPIAGALQRRGHGALAQRLAQRRQRELQLALDEPVHAQAPRDRVDLRHGAVPTHVERVGRRQRTLRQRRPRALGVERIVLVHDQIRTLAVAAQARSRRVGMLWRHDDDLDRIAASTVEVGATESIRALAVVRAALLSSERGGVAVPLGEVIDAAGAQVAAGV
jgi:hypothetical protein